MWFWFPVRNRVARRPRRTADEVCGTPVLTPARAIDILEAYGDERLWMNSACDWGRSDPLAVPKTALEMKKRGHLAAAIDQVIFQNPKKFLRQSPNFKLP